jgi:hypothetical protein
VLADVAQACGTQEGVAQSVEHNVSVGVGDDAARVRNAHAAEHDKVAGAKCVYVRA